MTTSDSRSAAVKGLPLRDDAGAFLVCPECGESVSNRSPVISVPGAPRVAWVHHADGEPLCPVMTSSGYLAADPITKQAFDDAHGCPCDGAYVCVCACTDCSCRTPAEGGDHR